MRHHSCTYKLRVSKFYTQNDLSNVLFIKVNTKVYYLQYIIQKTLTIYMSDLSQQLGANPVDNYLCKVCGHIGLTSVNPENPDLSALKILALCLFCNG